jgi:hypothetical protein
MFAAVRAYTQKTKFWSKIIISPILWNCDRNRGMKKEHQMAALDWFAQRREYREAHRRDVHEREGLGPVGEVGERWGMTGTRKGPKKALVEEIWGETGLPPAENRASDWFFHVDTCDASLNQELSDLTRDANRYAVAEYVRHEKADDLVSETFMPCCPETAIDKNGWICEPGFFEWCDEVVKRGEK